MTQLALGFIFILFVIYTLPAIPINYMILEDFKNFFNRLFRKKPYVSS
jgi:hypothetical protein